MEIPEFKKSEDGIELQFASNHVGHFLLTNLLMEKIIAAGRGARIVNVSSNGFELGEVRFDDWNFHVSDIQARKRHAKLMP
jgi:NAD(P)-dependent dehydrogenase (short-subunit alcohol dehydrogenase family)